MRARMSSSASNTPSAVTRRSPASANACPCSGDRHNLSDQISQTNCKVSTMAPSDRTRFAPNSAAARDIEYYLHPFTNLKAHEENGPLIVNEGKGVYVYDDQGNEIIEGMAGLWCTSLGFGEERLAKVAYEQMLQAALYAGLHPPLERGGDRSGRKAGLRWRRAIWARCSSPIPDRRPTTPRSRSSGTTTTRWAGPRRRRSSAATRPITASPWRRQPVGRRVCP